MIRGIYGVNVAVNDLSDATRRYERFFGVAGKPLGPEFFAFPGLRGAQIEVNGFHINLIATERDDTAVAKFLEKRGEGLFLLSVQVDDIEADVAALSKMDNAILLDANATGEFGAVNFIHPKSMTGVQVEIYQPAPAFLPRETA